MATRKGYLTDGLGNVVLPNTELDSVMDKATGRKLSEIVPDLAIKKDLHSYKELPISKGSTDSEIDTIYNNLHATAADGECYRRTVEHTKAHSKLGGGSFYLEGVRTNADYGWQKIRTYMRATNGEAVYNRTMYQGVWSDWIPDVLYVNMDVYVSTTGNDTTGNGTSAKPYATIDRALKSIPKDLNGNTAQIYIADGTYLGFTVTGFYNGYIRFFKSGTGVVTFNNTVTINNSSIVRFDSSFVFAPTDNTKPCLRALNNSCINVIAAQTFTGGSSGVLLETLSEASFADIQTFTNNTYAVLSYTSKAIFNKISGSGNTNGLSSNTGSYITYNSITQIATNLFSYTSGGVIKPELTSTNIVITATDPGANANYAGYPDGTLVVVYE